MTSKTRRSNNSSNSGRRRGYSGAKKKHSEIRTDATSQAPNSELNITFPVDKNSEDKESDNQKSMTLHLFRYPKERQHVSLQAWDAADEYLIQHVNELELPDTATILILNDEFGAIACALAKSKESQFSILWQSDSIIAEKALRQNLELNEISDTCVYRMNSLADVSETSSDFPTPNLVLIKLPRSHALLEHQLAMLQKLPEKTPVIAGGKVKAVQTSVLELFEKYMAETKTSLAVKKARLIFSKVGESDIVKPSPYPTIWKTELPEFTIANHANVFSRGQLDIGARLLLEHLPEASNKTVIDLGCGNGVLGLTMLHDNDVKKMIFVDESYMAIASAKLNVEENLQGQLEKCEFVASNCLEDLPEQKADIVVCNPPFHQQNTITDHIAWQMFQDAKQALHKGGELRVVANRHLQHHDKLKRLFGGYQVVASNEKFSILSAIKR